MADVVSITDRVKQTLTPTPPSPPTPTLADEMTTLAQQAEAGNLDFLVVIAKLRRDPASTSSEPEFDYMIYLPETTSENELLGAIEKTKMELIYGK